MLDLINNSKGGVGGNAFNHQGYHKNSFGYCASTFAFMCGSKGGHLVISSSYHTNISFIMNSLSYNTMYLSWLATSYSCPFHDVSVVITLMIKVSICFNALAEVNI
jgi:hypothetical protein